MNMYLFIRMRHNILNQCHEIYIGVKKNNYMFENNCNMTDVKELRKGTMA